MPVTQEIVQKLKELGVVMTKGHFVLSSGLHSGEYVDKDRIYSDRGTIQTLALELAKLVLANQRRNQRQDVMIQAVVVPDGGANVLAKYTAHYFAGLFEPPCPIPVMYATKYKNGIFALKGQNWRAARGQDFLLVDDVVTTGATLRGVVLAVETAKGRVITAATLWNRGNVKSTDIRSLFSLFSLVSLFGAYFPVYDPGEDLLGCPLCASRVPIDCAVGHGAAFLRRQEQKM